MVNHYAREVQIDITSRHQRVSLRTRVFAHDRLERLSRFNSWVSRIQLVLGEEHHEFLAEAIVHVDSRDPIVVSEVSGVLPDGGSVPVGTEVADGTKAVGDGSGTSSFEHATRATATSIDNNASLKTPVLTQKSHRVGGHRLAR